MIKERLVLCSLLMKPNFWLVLFRRLSLEFRIVCSFNLVFFNWFMWERSINRLPLYLLQFAFSVNSLCNRSSPGGGVKSEPGQSCSDWSVALVGGGGGGASEGGDQSADRLDWLGRICWEFAGECAVSVRDVWNVNWEPVYNIWGITDLFISLLHGCRLFTL